MVKCGFWFRRAAPGPRLCVSHELPREPVLLGYPLLDVARTSQSGKSLQTGSIISAPISQHQGGQPTLHETWKVPVMVWCGTLKKKNRKRCIFWFKKQKQKVVEMMFAGSLAIQKQKLFIMLWLKVRRVLTLDPPTEQLTNPGVENDCQMLWSPPGHAGATVQSEFSAWDRWTFGELLSFTACHRPRHSCVIITQTASGEHFCTLWLMPQVELFTPA